MNEAMERAHEAWKRRWDARKPERKPPRGRYVVVFEADETTFQAVLDALKSFPISSRTYRKVRLGWRPGDPI